MALQQNKKNNNNKPRQVYRSRPQYNKSVNNNYNHSGRNARPVPINRSAAAIARRRQIIMIRRVAAIMLLLMAAGLIALIVAGIVSLFTPDEEPVTVQTVDVGVESVENDVMFHASHTVAPVIEEEIIPELPKKSDDTVSFGDAVDAQFAVLIDAQSNEILAQKGCNTVIYPASMTKVMTALVAAENVDDVNSTCVMTYDMLNPLIQASASRAGFWEGDEVTFKDLMYGALLPSGADGTLGLATIVSGSEEEFVKLMNKKAEELGLKNTHFTNTSGLHSTSNYTTPLEMAVIMKAAMENDLVREVITTYKYTTAPTEHFPEGIELTSTMFSRMYGDEVEGVKILAGKTGYTDEARHCLVSCAEKDGREYIAVTAYGSTKWQEIYDAFTIYGDYLPESENTSEIADASAETVSQYVSELPVSE